MEGNTNNYWIAMSDRAIVSAIGKFIKHVRLEQNKTQEHVAKEAGINRWTVSQIEKGESVTLTTLIQILRTLDLLPLLKIFTIENKISPIEYAKLQKNKRQRARNTDKKSGDDLGW